MLRSQPHGGHVDFRRILTFCLLADASSGVATTEGAYCAVGRTRPARSWVVSGAGALEDASVNIEQLLSMRLSAGLSGVTKNNTVQVGRH